MYKQYLVVKSSKTGDGLFTTIELPANVPLFEVLGEVRKLEELPDPTHPAILQVGPNTYIGPTAGPCDSINHSCNPNCRMSIVGNRAICYSIYVIPKGAELTFDYSTTSNETHDTWKMDCACGSFKCRKVISGFQYLADDLQQEYRDKNLVPLYISEPGKVQKKW